MNTNQKKLAYDEISKTNERLRFLTYIWEGKKAYLETYNCDNYHTGADEDYSGIKWYKNPEEANAYYKYNLKLVLVEDTPTIDPVTKVITRHKLETL